MGTEPEWHLSKDINDQQVHEKVLNIANHQQNANQNHNEISTHTSLNGYYQKTRNKCWRQFEEQRTLRHCWREYKLM